MERSHSSSASSNCSQEVKPKSPAGSGGEDSDGSHSTSQEGSETNEEDEAGSDGEASGNGEGSDGGSSDSEGSSGDSEITDAADQDSAEGVSCSIVCPFLVFQGKLK